MTHCTRHSTTQRAIFILQYQVYFWKRLVTGENDMYKQLNVAIFSRHLAHCDQASNLQLFSVGPNLLLNIRDHRPIDLPLSFDYL